MNLSKETFLESDLNIIYAPDIDPVALALGPLDIRWYALAYLAGFIFVYMSFAFFAKPLTLGKNHNHGQLKQMVDDLLIYAVLGVVLGGRIGYVLFYQPYLLWSNPIQALRIWDGGMSFHGGLFGVLLACLIFARKQKIPYLALMDVLAVSTPVALFFGRIANFVNGELWGRTSDVPWAMLFKNACYPNPMNYKQLWGDAPWSAVFKDAYLLNPATCSPRHPSQLYEAALEGLLLFIIMIIAWKMPLFRRKTGLLSALFLLGYAFFRFIVEFFREPDIGLDDIFFGLTMGQTLSLSMVAIAVYLISPYNKQKNNQ